MTDVAYLCHNCGSVHEVESIRQNLVLDLRAAASYQLSRQRGILNPRASFRRWRIARGLAQALWPNYSQQPCPARCRRLPPGRPVPLPDRTIPCRAATDGGDDRRCDLPGDFVVGTGGQEADEAGFGNAGNQ
jgi:hypothetical protein